MEYRTVHRGNRLERELPALRLLSVITAVWFLAAGWADVLMGYTLLAVLGVSALIKRFQPEQAVFEELFFYRNTTTALAVGAGRGVAILAGQQAGLPLYEYTPMQIKLAVTGDGHADKRAVQQMVKILLCLKSVPKPDDAADALAAAICHGCTMGPAAEEFRIR